MVQKKAQSRRKTVGVDPKRFAILVLAALSVAVLLWILMQMLIKDVSTNLLEYMILTVFSLCIAWLSVAIPGRGGIELPSGVKYYGRISIFILIILIHVSSASVGSSSSHAKEPNEETDETAGLTKTQVSQPQNELPTRNFIALAVSNYMNLEPLEHSESDAQVLAKTLKESYGFQPHLLLGPNCTQSGIKDFLNGRLAEIPPNSTNILFISLWGVTKETSMGNVAYLAPFDSVVGDSDISLSQLRDQFYPLDWIFSDLLSPNQRWVVLIDACRNYFDNPMTAGKISDRELYVVAGLREFPYSGEMLNGGSLAAALTEVLDKRRRTNCTALGMEISDAFTKLSVSSESKRSPYHGFWNGGSSFTVLDDSFYPSASHSSKISVIDSLALMRRNFGLFSAVSAETQLSNPANDYENELVPSPSRNTLSRVSDNVRVELERLQSDPPGYPKRLALIKKSKSRLEIDPDDVEAHFLIAQACYLMESEVETGRAHCLAILKINPLFGPAYGLLGDYESRQGEFDSALIAFDQAVRLSPESPLVWNGLGATLLKYFESDEPVSNEDRNLMLDQAIAALDEGIERKEYFTIGKEIAMMEKLYYNRARCQHHKGNFESAIHDYQTSLEYNPKGKLQKSKLECLEAAKKGQPLPVSVKPLQQTN